MTNDGANTLAYDDESKITAVTGSCGSGSYQYDGSGMRVEKTVSGVTTVYIFSGSQARCLRSGGLCGMIAEYASGAAPSSPQKEFIYARGGAPMSSQTRSSPRRQDRTTLPIAEIDSGSSVKYYEAEGHWDYNPWTERSLPWQNIPRQ